MKDVGTVTRCQWVVDPRAMRIVGVRVWEGHHGSCRHKCCGKSEKVQLIWVRMVGGRFL